jgi:hypothetical protein
LANLKTFYALSGVALEGFGKGLLKNHMTEIKELIKRDKNRPSVVMWSLANEPRFSFIFLLLLLTQSVWKGYGKVRPLLTGPSPVFLYMYGPATNVHSLSSSCVDCRAVM